MNDSNKTKTHAIVGANGKTGRRIAARLEAMDQSVRPLGRSTPIRFDWEDPSTWGPAVKGAETLYVSYQPDLAVPGAADRVAGLGREAARAGVERVVLLSGRGEPQAEAGKQAIKDCGVDWTIMDCAFFAQNFTEGAMVPVDDTIYFLADGVKEPFIDCDDIADVAVAALTEPGHQGQIHELTGPRGLSFDEATAILARATDRPLRYQQLTPEAYAEVLSQHLPRPAVDFFIELFTFLMDGHNAQPTDGVERVLGRPATSFEQFAQRTGR